MHGVLLSVVSADAYSCMLLWIDSLACILKFSAGVLGDRRRIIYSSPLVNTPELAESLPQEKVVQHIVRDMCVLLLVLKPSKESQ